MPQAFAGRIVTTFATWLPTTTARDCGDAAVDDAMIRVLRLALVEPWSLTGAATELRDQTDNEAILWRARIRASHALRGRPCVVTERATAILDETLKLIFGTYDLDHVATCGWPYGTPCPRCYPPS